MSGRWARWGIAIAAATVAGGSFAAPTDAHAQTQSIDDASSEAAADGEDLRLPIVAMDPFGTGEPLLSRGWSMPATWIGILSTALVAALGLTAVAAAESPDNDFGLAFGTATVGVLGLAGPIVALGGVSARTHAFVPGNVPLQVAAWICWGLSLVGGVALLAADLDENEPARFAFIAPTVVGAASLVLFSFDALISAIQVDLVNGGPPP